MILCEINRACKILLVLKRMESKNEDAEMGHMQRKKEASGRDRLVPKKFWMMMLQKKGWFSFYETSKYKDLVGDDWSDMILYYHTGIFICIYQHRCNVKYSNPCPSSFPLILKVNRRPVYFNIFLQPFHSNQNWAGWLGCCCCFGLKLSPQIEY